MRTGWPRRCWAPSTGAAAGSTGWRPGRLAELERRLSAKGCRKINLLIEPDNQAVTGFYRRHGYAEDELIFMEKWLLQLCASE
jgi:hypothetical protein